MPPPVLILITGLPCTGKTTLAYWIAAEFRLPLVYKDGIKEILFDELGWSDRKWSKQLSNASFSLLYYFLEAQLSAGRSAIVEGNFNAERDQAKLLSLRNTYGFEPFQIHCVADEKTLLQRYMRRYEMGERHPGHVDPLAYEEFKSILLKGRPAPLSIRGSLYEVDTTRFDQIDHGRLCAAIREVMEGTAGE